MYVPIGQLYPVLIVLWGMLLWARSKVFRATILISFCLHGIFLVRIGAREAKETERERIISFTFVQGAEQTEKPPAPEGINPLSEPRPEAEPPTPKETEEEPEEPSPPEEKMPEPPRAIEGLPKIEDSSLIDFSANPEAKSYRDELIRLIRVYQKAPPEVLVQGVEARVRIHFNVSRDGTLNLPVVIDPKIRSSRDIVNGAAVDSVVAAAEHFPPFPENVDKAELWFHVDVDFGPSRFPGD
jgi:outer membrane biosynthesis protein TonB